MSTGKTILLRRIVEFCSFLLTERGKHNSSHWYFTQLKIILEKCISKY